CERPPRTGPRNKSLLEQPIERGHDRGGRDLTRQASRDPARSARAHLPDHHQRLTLEVAEHSTQRVVGAAPAETPEPFEHERVKFYPVLLASPRSVLVLSLCPLILEMAHMLLRSRQSGSL